MLLPPYCQNKFFIDENLKEPISQFPLTAYFSYDILIFAYICFSERDTDTTTINTTINHIIGKYISSENENIKKKFNIANEDDIKKIVIIIDNIKDLYNQDPESSHSYNKLNEIQQNINALNEVILKKISLIALNYFWKKLLDQINEDYNNRYDAPPDKNPCLYYKNGNVEISDNDILFNEAIENLKTLIFSNINDDGKKVSIINNTITGSEIVFDLSQRGCAIIFGTDPEVLDEVEKQNFGGVRRGKSKKEGAINVKQTDIRESPQTTNKLYSKDI